VRSGSGCRTGATGERHGSGGRRPAGLGGAGARRAV